MKGYRASDEVNVIRRIGIDRRAGYVGIPQAIGRERYKAIQAGELAHCHTSARSGLRKGGTAEEKDDGEREGERPMQVVSHSVSFKRLLSSTVGLSLRPLRLGIREEDEMAHQIKKYRVRCQRKLRLSSLPSNIDDWLFLFAIRS